MTPAVTGSRRCDLLLTVGLRIVCAMCPADLRQVYVTVCGLPKLSTACWASSRQALLL